MRIYEELFIVRPDATDEEVDPVIDQLKNVITQAGGTVEKTEKWGVRRLAYRVVKYDEGQYVLLQFSAKPETVKEIERRLRVSDLVLKFLTVRIDEKLKRIEKRRKAREKRAARKPPPAPQAPVLASPAMPHEPPAPVPGAPAPAAPAQPSTPPTERPE
jgi:small subunit ribosomal protein S6